MKLNAVMKQLNPHSIVEIIDNGNTRIFYGYAGIFKSGWPFNNKNVAEINPFLAEVGDNEFEPAVQIRISEILHG